MVNLLTLSLAAVALTPLAGAVPTTTRDVASAPAPFFSFAKWVDDIIATPEEAATPQQALDACYAYANSTLTDNVLPETASKMHKRAMCNTVVGKQAPIPDATCEVYRGTNHVSFVVRGNAEMIGVRPDTNGASTICNNVARAGGKIMDACSRADNRVEGEEITPDAAAIAVHIIQRGGC
ncbi:hypothetical protein QR685DRAFT_571066 [Neurospora intermedia]|uniref:Ecp2 effector protein domain-containing protein n=1 Tax=Neurospora intermedia TaxID=5142 RepID=A0ABR3DJM0_NEUIN